MSNVIRMRLLGRCVVRGGALYNKGEVAAFSPEVAEELFSAGVAEVVPSPEEEEPDMPAKPANSKSLQGPPAHKQIKWAPMHKGGRRQ